jgi:hypothetical protein
MSAPTQQPPRELRATLKPLGAVAVFALPRCGKVWLAHRDGEGGEFNREQVVRLLGSPEALEQYFWKHL